jgi:hypothetical protein
VTWSSLGFISGCNVKRGFAPPDSSRHPRSTISRKKPSKLRKYASGQKTESVVVFRRRVFVVFCARERSREESSSRVPARRVAHHCKHSGLVPCPARETIGEIKRSPVRDLAKNAATEFPPGHPKQPRFIRSFEFNAARLNLSPTRCLN